MIDSNHEMEKRARAGGQGWGARPGGHGQGGRGREENSGTKAGEGKENNRDPAFVVKFY